MRNIPWYHGTARTERFAIYVVASVSSDIEKINHTCYLRLLDADIFFANLFFLFPVVLKGLIKLRASMVRPLLKVTEK